MILGTTLIVVLALIAILIGIVLCRPYNDCWGYGPSAVLGLFAATLVVLKATGQI